MTRPPRWRVDQVQSHVKAERRRVDAVPRRRPAEEAVRRLVGPVDHREREPAQLFFCLGVRSPLDDDREATSGVGALGIRRRAVIF